MDLLRRNSRLRPLTARAALVAGLLLLLAPSGFTWESCREAVASQEGGAELAKGLNYSILFMLSMVLLIPAGFALAIWNSYRVARQKSGADGGIE